MLELVPNYRPAVTHVHGDTNYADYLFSAYPQPRLSGYLDISTPVVVSAGVCPVSRVTCHVSRVQVVASPHRFLLPSPDGASVSYQGAGQVAGDGAPAPVLGCTRRTTQYKYLFIPSIAVQCTTGQGRAGAAA